MIHNISLVLDDESVNAKKRVTKATGAKKLFFLDTAAVPFDHVTV